MTLYEFASKLTKSSNSLNMAAMTKRSHSDFGKQTYTTISEVSKHYKYFPRVFLWFKMQITVHRT